MNASYEWLRAFVPFDETPAELRDLITARVATVDEIVSLRADLAPFVVGRVVEAGPHPDSDHLWVTKVDAGTGELLDVVCGAPVVKVGARYPFAMTGTMMPNGLKIERRKIRGAVSNGMLCSPRELGLGDDHAGIMELNVDAAPGTPFLQVLPVGDTRIVIDVSPNRPDLLSHLGVAREIAAATDRALALPDVEGTASMSVPSPIRARANGETGAISVRVDEDGLVRRYMGVVIRGLTVRPSPDWLVKRLEAVGSRTINNVVDATNYILHELGQPTHAFDLRKLDGNTVIVRRARAAEKITTLDGTERELNDSITVIADARAPHAVAGVMGGSDSEVSAATTDIFLEVASFDPSRTRAARKKLGLATDASYRFERGVDPSLAPVALERAVRIIVALAGGRIDGAPVDLYAGDPARTPLLLRASRVAKLLGEPVAPDSAATLLRTVGFEAKVEANGDALRVLPPSWRSDVGLEVDLIEEVARLRGYDSFPDEIRPFRPSNAPDHPQWLVARRVREALVGAGLLETRPMPFVHGADGDFVRVANPLAENEAFLRREVLDTLARRAEYNLSHMQGNVRLFEIGAVFYPGTTALPLEELHAAALVMGLRRPPHFTDPKSEDFEASMVLDEWDVKALAERLVRAAYPASTYEMQPSAHRESTLWDIVVDGAVRGAVRRVALDAPVWAKPAYGVELSLGAMDSSPVAPPGASAHRVPEYIPSRGQTYRTLPTTPASEFDLALLVPDRTTAAEIEAVIRHSSGDLLESLQLVDQYAGKNIEPGHRSLAWRLTFRHPDRTLGAKEIEGRRSKILRTLESELNVRQRSS